MNNQQVSPLCCSCPNTYIRTRDYGTHVHTHINHIHQCNSPEEVENQNTTAHLSYFVPMPLYTPFQVGDPNKTIYFITDSIPLVKSSWLLTKICGINEENAARERAL